MKTFKEKIETIIILSIVPIIILFIAISLLMRYDYNNKLLEYQTDKFINKENEIKRLREANQIDQSIKELKELEDKVFNERLNQFKQ